MAGLQTALARPHASLAGIIATSSLCDSGKRLAGFLESGLLARELLPATDRYIDVDRIEFDAARNAASLFGGDEDGTAADEGIQHQVAATGAVAQSVGNQGNGLWRWVVLVHFVGAGPRDVGTWIGPHIAAV